MRIQSIVVFFLMISISCKENGNLNKLQEMILNQNDFTSEEYGIMFNKELTNCEQFQKGEFVGYTDDKREIKISRTMTKQIEEFEGKKVEYDIKWIGPCRYTLKEVSESSYYYKSFIVNIFEKSDIGYKYIATPSVEVKYDVSEIYFRD